MRFLGKLGNIVKSRLENPTEKSYTARLAAAGSQRIAQKVGEEGVELAIAAALGNKKEITNEAADLVYHLIVLLSAHDLDLIDVAECLESRHKGNDE